MSIFLSMFGLVIGALAPLWVACCIFAFRNGLKRSGASANGCGLHLEQLEGRLVPAAVIVEPAPTAAYPYSPVSGVLFGPNGPSYLDMRQGAVGDCWLDASIAEVAARNPSLIRSMFANDGTVAGITTFTVGFYNNNGIRQYVNVDTELPAGGDYYDQPINGVLWVPLLEKAYAKANAAGIVKTGSPGSDSYAALNEGDPTWALQAITGQSASDYSINPSNVSAAWSSGKLIVLDTTNPANTYVVANHAYAVVGYNAQSSQPFEIFNPWGTASVFVSPGPNSSGWLAPATENGHAVYGLFFANATFLTNNFTAESIGLGTAPRNYGSLALSNFGTTNASGQMPNMSNGHQVGDLANVNADIVPQSSAGRPLGIEPAGGKVDQKNISEELSDLLFAPNQPWPQHRL